MEIKLFVRKLTNKLVSIFPASLTRHLLKSLFYLPRLQDELRFHILPYRYDSPIPTSYDIDVKRLNEERHLPGIRLNEASILELLEKLQGYAPEFHPQPVEKTPGAEFWFNNGSYADLDAMSLYCMLRLIKPRRIIEVGCGYSSRVMTLAVRKNTAEGHPADCLFIEPYPPELIKQFSLAGPLIESKIEEVPLSTFQQLEAGDVLFIDTSHVLKCQNDCCYELLRIIPSLADGVHVHVHDIFTPFDYPADWLLEKAFYFNEQYGLECLLTDNRKIEVTLPLFWLSRKHPKTLAQLHAGSSRPGAFWMKKVRDDRAE